MADPTATTPAAPAPTPAPAGSGASDLGELPLGDYIRARQGASAAPPAAPVAQGDGDPGSLLEAQEQGEAAAVAGETARERAAKASRTRGVMQARIDDLTREKGDLLSLHAGTVKRLEALEQRLGTPAPGAPTNGHGHAPAAPVAPSVPDEPRLQQFLDAGKTYEDWVDARAEWRADQKIAAALQSERQRASSDAAAQAFAEQVGGFVDRAAAVRQAHPDFDQAVTENDQVQLSPVMSHVTLTSARGAEIAYFLGTHPDIANEIAQLTQAYPPQAYPLVERHLVALLAPGTAGPSPTGSVPVAAPITRAPAPISPVGGGVTPAVVPLDELPLGDYMRRRTADQQKRGRR